jgi:hypothetical protein
MTFSISTSHDPIVLLQLADLVTEDAKVDKLRSLPLHSYRITGWKFICSICYDKVSHDFISYYST